VDAGKLGLAAGFLVAGAAVGWAYFALLRCSIRRTVAGRAAVGRFALFLAPRLALFAAGVYVSLRMGPLCLAGYVIGFLVSRTIILGRARNAIARAQEPGQGDRPQD